MLEILAKLSMVIMFIILFVLSYKALNNRTLMMFESDDIKNLDEVCKLFGKLYLSEGIIILVCFILWLFFPQQDTALTHIYNVSLIMFFLFNRLINKRYVMKS